MCSVALVVLDTLRKDAFDDYFDWLPGRRFENAWTTSHWTTPVHASLFTGLYPSEHGVYAKSQHFDIDTMTLVEQLAAAGYRTAGFSANPNVTTTFDFDRGFDLFDGDTGIRSFSDRVFDWSAFTTNHADEGPIRYLRAINECVRSDCDTTESLRRGVLLKLHDAGLWQPVDSGATAALDWLRGQSFDDSFVFLNLMEAHDPYDRIPETYRTDPTYDPPKNIGLQHSFDPPDQARVRTAYHDAARYLSDIYRDIFAELRTEMDYIITVSDHGELLGEHDLWGHTYSLYSEVTNVPLVVWESGTTSTTTVDEQVSLLDVHATVLDAAEIDADSRGRSLLSDLSPTPRLVEGHGLTSYRRTGLESDGYDVTKYDTELRGVAAPSTAYGHWTADQWVTERGDEATLRSELDTLVAYLDERQNLTQTALDDATIDQLRDLGYA